MKNLLSALLCVCAFLTLSVATSAQLCIIDDFESYTIPPGPTGDAGTPWEVGGNVFDANGNFVFNYFGGIPAPHATGNLSNIGTDGTNQFMEVFSDYNVGERFTLGWQVESFFFQNHVLGPDDVGLPFAFDFDQANINADFSDPQLVNYVAFVRVFPPDFSGLILDLQVPVNQTSDFVTRSISGQIDPAWEGFNVQFGFFSLSTGGVPTAIAIDNTSFKVIPPTVPTMGEWGVINLSIVFLIVGVVSIRREDFVLG